MTTRPPSRPSGLGWLAIAVVALGLLLIGIGIARQSPGAQDGAAGSDATSGELAADAVAGELPSDEAASGEALSAATGSGVLAGLRVGLDPGHNGGNADRPAETGALVSDGRGGTKPCNTVGTATADGYPEHAFTWDVATRTRDLLRGLGATVLLTRDSDDGVGPCVDERGTFGQDHDADLVVSIHADGSEDTTLRGFFAIVADPPLDPSQEAPSLALAADLLAALDDAGFTRSGAYPDGLSLRSDIAGLNHARRPAVLLELGEMRNADDAALLSSHEGRGRFAEAIVVGVTAWASRDEPATAP